MRQKPADKCLNCEHWTKQFCLMRMHGYPVIGPACEKWTREPGSDDDKDERGK